MSKEIFFSSILEIDTLVTIFCPWTLILANGS